MLTKSQIISQIASVQSELKERFELEHLYLYGSYALEKQNEESDIDLMYVMRTNAKMTLGRLEKLEDKLKALLQVPKIEMVNQKYMNPVIANQIESYVVCLF